MKALFSSLSPLKVLLRPLNQWFVSWVSYLNKSSIVQSLRQCWSWNPDIGMIQVEHFDWLEVYEAVEASGRNDERLAVVLEESTGKPVTVHLEIRTWNQSKQSFVYTLSGDQDLQSKHGNMCKSKSWRMETFEMPRAVYTLSGDQDLCLHSKWPTITEVTAVA